MASSRSCFAVALPAVLGLFCFGYGMAGLSGVGPALAQQQQPAASVANFTVSAAGGASVLVEVHSGRTWLLRTSVDRTTPAAWLPIERINSPDEAAKWHVAEAERSKIRVERQQQAREKSENLSRLRNLETQLTNHRGHSVDAKRNAVVAQLEKEIAELKATLAEQK